MIPFTQNTQTKQNIIFIMGAPGSGKGTHGKLVGEKHRYHHIAIGDLVRSMVANGDYPEIVEHMKRGELLDDKFILDLIDQEMKNHPEAFGYLIDGYPRTKKQWLLFEEHIRVPDKILYFVADDAVLEERLIARGKADGRIDDNAATIKKRLEFYYSETFPLIEELKQHYPDKFMTIASQGNIEDVAEIVEKSLREKPAQVSFLEFLSLYLTCGNFYKAVQTLENRYHQSDFTVNLGYITLFNVLQNKEDVKKMLTVNTQTGYQNRNFDLAHGHDFNINATQAFDSKTNAPNLLWQTIHSSLAQSVSDQATITKLISKHMRKLFAKPTFALDLAFEDFMLSFWCEYLFGPCVDAEKFKATREKLLRTLRYTFYDSRLRNIPWVGSKACQFYRYLKRDELTAIDNELKDYIQQANGGLVAKFRDKLKKACHFPQDKIDQAVLDNVFDFVLVFDFIHNAMYETLVAILKAQADTTDERKRLYQQGLSTAYLFPFRSRVPQQDIDVNGITITKGTPVYINLLKSGLYHSFGPRACIGIGVTNWIKEAIWSHLAGMQLRILSRSYPKEREQLSHNPDVPISPERYIVKWQYPRAYLQNALQAYTFKGVDKFYDVLKIYENPVLTNYIINTFIEQIEKKQLDKKNICIATPEVRGIPIAAMVAHLLQVPLVVIRKSGRLPGETITQQYRNAYNAEALQLSKTSDLKDRDVILIDDGIASGGTTLTCCDLIKQMQGRVKMVLCVLNHTYKTKPNSLENYDIRTLFDINNDAHKYLPESNNKMFSHYSQALGFFKNPVIASRVPIAYVESYDKASTKIFEAKV